MNQSLASSYAAFLLRTAMGIMFLAHAILLKVFTFTLAGTEAYFGSIGYPPFFAHLVILAETAGGLALILGIHARWVSLGLVPVMIGAAIEHVGNGWVFNATGGGWEFPVFWTVTLLVQALLGDGAFALTSRVRALFGAPRTSLA